MSNWIIISAIGLVYLWAFLQIHIDAGMSLIKAICCLSLEVFLAIVMMNFITNGFIWNAILNGVANNA